MVVSLYRRSPSTSNSSSLEVITLCVLIHTISFCVVTACSLIQFIVDRRDMKKYILTSEIKRKKQYDEKTWPKNMRNYLQAISSFAACSLDISLSFALELIVVVEQGRSNNLLIHDGRLKAHISLTSNNINYFKALSMHGPDQTYKSGNSYLIPKLHA